MGNALPPPPPSTNLSSYRDGGAASSQPKRDDEDDALWRRGDDEDDAAANVTHETSQPIEGYGHYRGRPTPTTAQKIPTFSKYRDGAASEGVYFGDRRHAAASIFSRRPIGRRFEDVEQRLRKIPGVGRQRI